MIKKTTIKRLLIMLLVGGALLLIFEIYNRFQNDDVFTRRCNMEASSPQDGYKNSTISIEMPKHQQLNLQKRYVVLRKVDYNYKESKLEKAPFEYIGGSGTGKIIDANGNTILSSDSKNGINIFGAKISLNKELICVEGGNGKSWILNPRTQTLITIPKNPPIENSFAFSSWEWINNDLLIALSGIQILGSDGNPITSCGGNTAAETKLYTYRISSRELAEVKLPEDFPVKVFNINRVSSEGYIEITYDEHDQHPPEAHEGKHAHSFQNKNGGLKNLGWFKIEE